MAGLKRKLQVSHGQTLAAKSLVCVFTCFMCARETLVPQQADLHKLSTSATEEIDKLLEAQRALDLRYRTLKSFEDELVVEREALDKCLTSMTTRTNQLNKWLEENENAGLVEDDPEDEANDDQQRELKRVDDMFVAKDEIHKALLSATARDQAIEDTIYALEEVTWVSSLIPSFWKEREGRNSFFCSDLAFSLFPTLLCLGSRH